MEMSKSGCAFRLRRPLGMPLNSQGAFPRKRFGAFFATPSTELAVNRRGHRGPVDDQCSPSVTSREEERAASFLSWFPRLSDLVTLTTIAAQSKLTQRRDASRSGCALIRIVG